MSTTPGRRRPSTPPWEGVLIQLASIALIALLLPAPASQATPSSELDTLLTQIGSNAARYRATLPSLGADETITSQASVFGLSEHAEAKATFRVTRPAPDAPLEESRQITLLNGKPVPEGHEVHLPLTFSGAFGDALEIFFSPSLRPCLDFTLQPAPAPDGSQQIGFTAHPGTENLPACAHTPPGVSGFVRIDPATQQIRHLERAVPQHFASPRHIATLVAVEYAPTSVGNETFWLPTLIHAQLQNGKTQFTARYSNYHRFTGTIRLLPNITPLDPPPQ